MKQSAKKVKRKKNGKGRGIEESTVTVDLFGVVMQEGPNSDGWADGRAWERG